MLIKQLLKLQMKFKNIEEKEEKLDALVFLKNQILRKAEKLGIK